MLGWGCGTLGTDLNQVVAIELQIPDSGHTEEGDTIHVHARAINGNGDSVAAPIAWETLDTAHILVLDSLGGVLYARAPGGGLVEARVGTLRSNPVLFTIDPQADTIISADTSLRDSVSLGAKADSLSDSVGVILQDLTTDTVPHTLSGRPVRFQISPADTSLYVLLPDTIVFTNGAGIAYVQVRHKNATPTDSATVTATAVRGNGSPVPGSVTFTLVFTP